jgi:hypothetical protein
MKASTLQDYKNLILNLPTGKLTNDENYGGNIIVHFDSAYELDL